MYVYTHVHVGVSHMICVHGIVSRCASIVIELMMSFEKLCIVVHVGVLVIIVIVILKEHVYNSITSRGMENMS